MNKNKPNKRNQILFLSFLLSFSVIGLAFEDDLFQISKNIDIFTNVYKEITLNYVDEVDPSKIIRKGIDAMLDELDPYTEYIPESEIEDYKLKYVNTQYGGIGASVFTRDNKTFIAEVYEGYPAQLNDLRPGDELLSIDNVLLSSKKTDDISSLLKGAKATTVKVKIARPGVGVLEKSITRDEIKQKNVPYSGVLSNNVGYIKLDKFLEHSSEEVKAALVELTTDKKVSGIVLDLRNNGGGLLGEAVKIVNLFVPKNTDVVIQKGRNIEIPIVYKTTHNPISPEIPLVVLINANSASASEIVAGSLQDLDRAVIIGQRSYGKGLVQQTYNLPYNSLIKVTVAKYYVSSGRCIQSLDYSHKNSKGLASRTADSSMVEFKTKKGRSVYDGNGIYPDIFVKGDKDDSFLEYILSNYLLFDFATKYRNEHTSILSPENYKVSDEVFNEFIAYSSSKSVTINYQTKADKILKELKQELDKNKSFDVKTEIESLKTKVQASKKTEFLNHKSQIKQLLSTELAGRYFFEKGRMLCYFQFDDEISEAYKVLGSPTKYNSILNGEGPYKIIGKPNAKN